MGEQLKQYILKKLHEVESEKHQGNRFPVHVTGRELAERVMIDMNAAMDDLVQEGTVTMGRTLNDNWYQLNPENVID